MRSSTQDSSQEQKNQDFEDQRELLESLDDAFEYEGRVQSGYASGEKLNYRQFRSGYVSVMGAPNMGKSTLVNALVKEPLCIATRRPQTTRHAILGILTEHYSMDENNNNNSDNTNICSCQVCLLDTPGILETPAYKLQEGMMEAVQGALKDANVILIVTDLFSTPIPNDDLFAKVQQLQGKLPIVVVINKVDLMDQVQKNNNKMGSTSNDNNNSKKDETILSKTATVPEAIARWRQYLPEAMAILPTSAANGPDDVGVVALRHLLTGHPDLQASIRALGRPISGMFVDPTAIGVDVQQARQLLPLGPPLYSEELYTDRSERYVFFAWFFMLFWINRLSFVTYGWVTDAWNNLWITLTSLFSFIPKLIIHPALHTVF